MRIFGIAAIALAVPVAALAQDPAKVDAGHYKVVLDNAAVRVLKVTVGVGEKTPMHTHPDSVLVALAGGTVRFTMPDGKTADVTLAPDQAQWAPGGPHSGVNTGTTPVSVLVVELKDAAAPKAVVPTSRPGMTATVLADNPRATAYRSTAGPTFSEPAGSKHDFDQVVIALGPTGISLSIDGKPAKTTWARGDVEFIGRGVPHESKNTSGKPVDIIIVAIK